MKSGLSYKLGDLENLDLYIYATRRYGGYYGIPHKTHKGRFCGSNKYCVILNPKATRGGPNCPTFKFG